MHQPMTSTSIVHPAEAPAVFISYSRERHPDGAKIAELAQFLRAKGYACDFDGFHATYQNGWPQDVLHAMRDAMFVLVVCDETYKRKFESRGGDSSGVKWEADEIVRQIRAGFSTKFIPIVLAEDDVVHIPGVLSEQNRIAWPAEHEKLLKRLRNEGEFLPIPIGAPGETSSSQVLMTPSRRKLIRETSDWVIGQLLHNQYDSAPVAGAWARDYIKYQRELYGKIENKESITCSAWIACALGLVRHRESRHQLRVLQALQSFERYVVEHHDPVTGGFGRMRTTLREDSVQAHARHTAWSMIALHIAASTPKGEVLSLAAGFLRQHLKNTRASAGSAITAAAIHRVLTDPDLGPLVYDSADERRRIVATELEPAITELYDNNGGTWDVKHEPARAATDTALFVLYSLGPPVTNALRDVMTQAMASLWSRAVDVGSGMVALPWLPGKPQLGASAVLLWLTLRDNAVGQIGTRNVSSLVDFVTSVEARRKGPGFSWDLASVVLIDSAFGMD